MATRYNRIIVGRISGVFGIKGWVKVFSYTEPRENIVRYSPWRLLRAGLTQVNEVAAGRCHGAAVVAKLRGVDAREAAASLGGADIEVARQQFDPLPHGEYYWADLQGLEVKDMRGVTLGRIDHLLCAGAHDVLVVEGERQRLIPFASSSIVKDVDLDRGVVWVDWSPDY